MQTRRLFLPLIGIGAAAGAAALTSQARCVPSRVDHCGRCAKSLAAATVPRISSATSDGALLRAKEAPDDVQLRIRDVILSKSAAPSTIDVAVGQAGGLEGLWWRGAIVILCAVWATNFVAIKLVYDAVPDMGPAEWSLLRFGLGAAALTPFFVRGWRDQRDAMVGGLEIGVWIALGYFGQAIGLLTTTADKSAFICSLHVVWVAIASGVISGAFEARVLLCSVLAVAGVGFLELAGATSPNVGDLWSFAQPIFFGTGYIRLGQLMRRNPDAALPVSSAKLVVCALAAGAWAAFEGGGVPQLHLDALFASTTAVGALLWCGLITTAGALAAESEAFKWVPATDAAIILSTEPLMASGFAYLALHETFGMTDAIGGALVVGACVLNEVLARDGADAGVAPLAHLPSRTLSFVDTCLAVDDAGDAHWWACPDVPDGETCRMVDYEGHLVVACEH